MQRFRHFMNTVRTNWSENPAARGAAKVAAGAVLVAEGMFGVVSNTIKRNGGKGGLVGGVFGVLFGAVFMFVSTFIAPTVPDDEVVTIGTVVEVETGRSSEGGTNYSAVYGYRVDGQDYLLHSSVSSSARPTIGAEVEIGYSEANPNNARRVGGFEGNAHRLFFWAGSFVAGISIFHVLFSLLLIGFGIKLIVDGRKERAGAGEQKQGFFKDIFSLARQAQHGDLDVSMTAAGTPGTSVGVPERAFRALIGGLTPGPVVPAASGAAVPAGFDPSQDASQIRPTPTGPPPPAQPAAGPPAGWYPAPDGSGRQQWWDGAGWTGHIGPSA